MKLNLNFPIKGLDGQPLKDKDNKEIFACQLLANQIANRPNGDVLKLFGWAQKLYNKVPLSLDKSDEKTLRELIETNEQMTILVKGQLLEAFENQTQSID